MTRSLMLAGVAVAATLISCGDEAGPSVNLPETTSFTSDHEDVVSKDQILTEMSLLPGFAGSEVILRETEIERLTVFIAPPSIGEAEELRLSLPTPFELVIEPVSTPLKTLQTLSDTLNNSVFQPDDIDENSPQSGRSRSVALALSEYDVVAFGVSWTENALVAYVESIDDVVELEADGIRVLVQEIGVDDAYEE